MAIYPILRIQSHLLRFRKTNFSLIHLRRPSIQVRHQNTRIRIGTVLSHEGIITTVGLPTLVIRIRVGIMFIPYHQSCNPVCLFGIDLLIYTDVDVAIHEIYCPG